MNQLFSVYLACTIFGVGVTIIDMLGILGDLFHEGEDGTDSGDDGSDHGDGGGHGDHGDGGGHGDHGDGGGHGDHGDSGDSGDHSNGGDHVDYGSHGEHGGHADHDDHEGDHDEANEQGEKGSVTSHEHYQERHVLIGILSVARSLVHFSVGFGPVGLVALATGRGSTSSLAWSVLVGVFTLVVGRVLRRIQRSELDSQLHDEDLIMEQGTVTVSIRNGQLGKVRIHLEGTYAERFARARNPQENFPVGSHIRIVDIADECVYVEKD